MINVNMQVFDRIQDMAVDPNAPAIMKYGPMLIGISYDGGQMNNTSSTCPFAVTVLNTNYGGMDGRRGHYHVHAQIGGERVEQEH